MQHAVDAKTRDDVLHWLATDASNIGYRGFRDGYGSLVGAELDRNMKNWGDEYRNGFLHGLAVSPLLASESREGEDQR
jgi:hypothetical protein